MTNINQAPLPRLSKAPLVRASLVKRRYIKYLALPFFTFCAGGSLEDVAIGVCCQVYDQFGCRKPDVEQYEPWDLFWKSTDVAEHCHASSSDPGNDAVFSNAIQNCSICDKFIP